MPHSRWSRVVLSLSIGLVVGLGAGAPLPSSASASPATPPQADSVSLSVMSLNIFYGGDDFDLATGDWCPVADGCPRTLRKVARYIRASGADVVGLQEAERNTTALARLLGWHSDPRAHVISRFPILRPAGGQGLYTFVEPVPGRIVAVANTHLPSSPYGPYKVQRGASRAKVLALEQRLRVAALTHVLRTLPRLAARGIPVFLTGDFNSPSHLDWTPAVADARPDVPFPSAGPPARRWPARASWTPTAPYTRTRWPIRASRGLPAARRVESRTSSTASTGCSPPVRPPPWPAGSSASAVTPRWTSRWPGGSRPTTVASSPPSRSRRPWRRRWCRRPSDG